MDTFKNPYEYESQDRELKQGLSPHQGVAEFSPHDIRIEIVKAVYKATAFIEDLEAAGRIFGNAHHIRQKIAEAAARTVLDRLEEDLLVSEG